MAVFPRPSSPRAAWADLKALLRQQERHKILIAIISIMMPMIIVWGFYLDSRTDKPKAQIIYVQNYAPGRTDEEIIRQNIADQKIRDAAIRQRQRDYQKVADKLGIDY